MEQEKKDRRFAPMAVLAVVVGCVFVAYGVFVATLQTGSSFFAVWIALGCLLFAWALCVHLGWWQASPAALRWAVRAVAMAFVAVVAVTWALCASAFGQDGYSATGADEDLDALVVLGAQVRETGPSIVLRYRLDAAYDYLAAHPNTVCVVSGGQGPNEPTTEAACMADYLRQRGIDPARIVQEGRSENTVQNICFSRELLGPDVRSVGVVTNDFHLYRAMALARKQGLPGVHGIAAPSQPLFLPQNLLRETCGLAKDKLLGNI